jgi:SAM-dependent methyltransferase
MTTATHHLRAELEPLSWPDRFERLKAVEKGLATAEERDAIGVLRSELAERALAELRPGWGSLPLKEALLRLPSKRMRGALTRAAKRARDRYIVDVMTGGAAFPAGPADGARLAVGLDERAIEMPLALRAARLDEPGEVLDAGAALNLPVVRQIAGRPAARVTHFTLPGADEPLFDGGGHFLYAYGDLRRMTYADATFDRIVCVSTLEHVGMDTTRFGAASPRDAGAGSAAVAELVRVLRPAGRMIITVPYGRAAEHGWFRIFDADGLADLLSPATGEQIDLRFFYYDGGWAEAGEAPPAAALDAGYSSDVITGIAVASVVKQGARR